MTDRQHVENLVKYRLERAKETVEDAKLLAKVGHWNPCVNRLCYSCFYAVTALLIQHGLSSSKHTGVRSLFNREFVRTEKIPKKMAMLYNDLFEKRQEGDYVDFVYFSESEIAPLIRQTEDFVNHMENTVGKK
ncbi:MAG: HEPN domain-containing protein [Desulfobacteraceae bacterium 4572_88]|nr:MAG: HEPN domain-containing protein [Desulfobacteraceae bacterium 4572_88]